MTVVQALLISILYYLNHAEPYVPFTYAWLNLMMISTLTGAILGDIKTGVIVGGTIQPLYLALTSVGGSAPVDKAAAGCVATASVITQGDHLRCSTRHFVCCCIDRLQPAHLKQNPHGRRYAQSG